jgi:hypothetical protein
MILMVDYARALKALLTVVLQAIHQLFRPTKFEGYLKRPSWNAKGRPARETWDSPPQAKKTGIQGHSRQVDYSLPDNAGFRT